MTFGLAVVATWSVQVHCMAFLALSSAVYYLVLNKEMTPYGSWYGYVP